MSEELSFDHRSTDSPEQAETSVYEVQPAGFWMRFWAYILDLVAVSGVTALIILPGGLINITEMTVGTVSLAGLISSLSAFLYFTVMTKLFRQTLGKMVFGLKVYAYKKESLSWADVLFREVVGRFIHRSLGFTNLLYLIVAFSPEKRGLHDRIADTFVALEPRKTKLFHVKNGVHLNPDS